MQPESDTPQPQPAAPPRVRAEPRQALAFFWPWIRPTLGRAALVVAFTLGASLCDVGQAWLLKDLLNKVLLRGDDEQGEEDDDEWLKKVQGGAPGAMALAATAMDSTAFAASARAPLPPGDSTSLVTFAGRAAQDPGWSSDPACKLLERTRRVLCAEDADLLPAATAWSWLPDAWPAALHPAPSKGPRVALAEAVRYQRAAEALLLPDPAKATPTRRVAAAQLSLEGRRRAREASFAAATATLGWIVPFAILLAIVLALLRYGENATSRAIVARIFFDVQCDAVAHTLSLTAGQVSDMRRGDLLARLNSDLSKSVNGVILPLAQLYVLQPVRLVVLFAGALFISWQLALGLVLLALTVLIPIRLGGRTIRRSATDRQSALADVLESMHQMFAGIRLVKAFRREDHERKRFQESTERAFRAELGVILARTLTRSGLRLMNDCTIPLLVAGGGYLIVNRMGGLDAGRFAAFAALVLLMYRPTKSMAMAYNSIQDALPSYLRLRELFDARPTIRDGEHAQELSRVREGLSLDKVSFAYTAGDPVLHEVSFDAPRGTTTAIVGATGSGKSTLMDLIARHLDPASGAVRVDGTPLTDLRLADYLSRVAVVGQHPFVFNGTLRENIRYGRLDASDEEVVAAAKLARVDEEISTLPGGYDYVAGERGSQLSGGQIQRLTLARALLRRPEILLLDEAMSALDATTERLVQEALDEASATCTTFVIAHRLSTVRHADQILVLHDGRLVERGTHDELVTAGGHFAALVKRMED